MPGNALELPCLHGNLLCTEIGVVPDLFEQTDAVSLVFIENLGDFLRSRHDIAGEVALGQDQRREPGANFLLKCCGLQLKASPEGDALLQVPRKKNAKHDKQAGLNISARPSAAQFPREIDAAQSRRDQREVMALIDVIQ